MADVNEFQLGAIRKDGDSIAVSISNVTDTLKFVPPKGYYNGSTDKVVKQDTDFVAANILDTATIFGVLGTASAGGGGGLPKTGQTTSYATGDDGNLEVGIARSYTYSDDGSISTQAENVLTDDATGLQWIRNHTLVTGTDAGGVEGNQDISGIMNLATALSRCNALTYNDKSDWRLPNVYELFSICSMEPTGGQPRIDRTAFPGTVSGDYWSSTTYPNTTSRALYVSFSWGLVLQLYKTNSYRVRAVRGGQ